MIDTKPMVSVIIPTYNRLAYLKQAVNSCLEQTYVRVEIIVVDDGSTDDTESSVRALIDGPWQGKVEYCKQDNAGASAARNRGLKLARGEYVQFLDSDDLLLPDKISKQLDEMRRVKEDAQGCNCYGFAGAIDGDLSSLRRIGIQCSSPREYVHELVMGRIHGMQTSAPLWRRDFLQSQDGWREDISLGDDREYHVRILASCREMLFVAEPLFILREHAGERLSDAYANLPRLLSAVKTLKSIVAVALEADLWVPVVHHGVLKDAQTLYVNLLQCGDETAIRDIETWIKQLCQVGVQPIGRTLGILFFMRKIVGHKAVFWLCQVSIRIRNRVK